MKTYQVSDEIEILNGDSGDDEPYEVDAYGPFDAVEAFVKETDDELYDGSVGEFYVQELGMPETRLVFQVTTHVKVTYTTKKMGIA